MSTEADVVVESAATATRGEVTGTDENTQGSPVVGKRKASTPAPADESSATRSPKRSRRDSEVAKRNGSARSPPAPSTTVDSRHAASQEEKKRGRRLFGGLLSTLSQTNSSSHQRRRQEIERRQQVKVSQQRAEDDKEREAKLAKLKAVRQREQIGWDEQVMRTRHRTMLATAKFLHTRTEPKIYYLPWDLTEDQEDLIKDQIRDAEELVDREVREFTQRKEARLQALGVISNVAPETHLEPDPKPQAQASLTELNPVQDALGKSDADALPHESPQAPDTNTDTTNRTTEQTGKAGHNHERENDEAGDVMVEGDEDMVIY